MRLIRLGIKRQFPGTSGPAKAGFSLEPLDRSQRFMVGGPTSGLVRDADTEGGFHSSTARMRVASS